jgi:hypothetical protein
MLKIQLVIHFISFHFVSFESDVKWYWKTISIFNVEILCLWNEGLGPEIAGFDPAKISSNADRDFYNEAPHYLLRPGEVLFI